MKANTALGFVFAGAAVWFLTCDEPRLRVAGQVCGALVVLLGLLTICEYILRLESGIDQILLREATSTARYPGRPSPITALEFSMMGVASLLFRRPSLRAHRTMQLLASLMMIFAYLAVIGYLYSMPALYTIAGYNSIALHTAVAFGVLGLAILMLDSNRGVIRLLTSRSAGGIVSRRMLPFALVAPVVVGWLRLKAQDFGFVDTTGGVLLFATVLAAMFVTVVLWAARSLDTVDRERRKLDEVGRLFAALKDTHQHL